MPELLAEWWLAAYLRRTATAYILLNAAHILGIGLLIGTIALLDLRLLGAFRRQPLAILGPPLARMAAIGTFLALLTGFCLFTVRPDAYLANPAFLTKLALIACGIANALALRRTEGWRRVIADGPITPAVRLGAALSLAFWTSAIIAGRWIGFL